MAPREVRTALLEADVHYEVVQDFVKKVSDVPQAEPQLIKRVRLDQQIIKIVHDELVALMGPADPSIRFEKDGPDGSRCALRSSRLGQDDDARQARRVCSRAKDGNLLVAADPSPCCGFSISPGSSAAS